MLQLRHSNIQIETIKQECDLNLRKTKIVCTIGPSCWSKEMLVKMIDSGMNVARLNFSHGNHEVHANTVSNIRAACAERPGKHVAIMLDTKGPEIRTGFFPEGVDKITLVKGTIVELTTDYEFLGNPTKFACSYKSLPKSVSVGSTILAADGLLIMKVAEILEDGVKVEIMNTATIGERKNMNLPGIIVDLPTITKKDEDDLINFGVAHGVDMVAASFVRKASDVTSIRNFLGPRGRDIQIICKIENLEGLENYDEILSATDGIMVARGDLGMEIPSEKVFLAQKMMIRKANIAGKTVITATQMLESMIKNPRPTRAECTDVANAVLDGTDCVMLSGETAGGDFPLFAVEMMSKICAEAESALNYPNLFSMVRGSVRSECGDVSTAEAICSSAVKTAIDTGAKMVVALTSTGKTARMVAKYRPQVPILVITNCDQTGRLVAGLVRGATVRVIGSMVDSDSILNRAAVIGKDLGWVTSGDTLVAVHGMKEEAPGATNMLKVLVVA